MAYRTADNEHRVLQGTIPWSIETFGWCVRPVLASRVGLRCHNTKDKPGHIVVHLEIRVNYFLDRWRLEWFNVVASDCDPFHVSINQVVPPTDSIHEAGSIPRNRVGEFLSYFWPDRWELQSNGEIDYIGFL